MARYLLEIYTPNRVEALDRARSLARSRGVRYLRTILVPEDQTCFHLVEARSAEAVRAAASEASVPLERIAEAVEISRRDLKEEP
jgi:hypothetical protein